MCISLDIALAGSGCEAVVEGFYSVVGAHKESGGQSNIVLMQGQLLIGAYHTQYALPIL